MSGTNNACKQDLCPVSQNGTCLESLPLKDCPHFYLRVEEPLDVNELSDSSSIASPSKIHLFSGEPIGVNSLSDITNQYDCKFLYILGGHDCGKTTLIATIFDLFQKGPLNNQLVFAGSRSLMGFEKRCFLSRANSGVLRSETERTKYREFLFLHLAIKQKGRESLPPQHFLISDISGEKTDNSTDSSKHMEELKIVKHASEIIYILDGEELANVRTRGAILFDAQIFIQKALDSGIFHNRTYLQIVVSKIDKLPAAFDLENEIFSIFQRKFGDKLNRLTCHAIAARPQKNNLGFRFGHGVYDLMKEWLEERSWAPDVFVESTHHSSIRSIHKFKYSE